MYEIIFVKWKWLITKSINDCVIGWWFECWLDLYQRLHTVINKPLILRCEYDWLEQDFNCNISLETKNHISFVIDHWLVKLDIQVPDILITWCILKWNLKLIID